MFSAMIWGWAARGKVSKLETKGISSQAAGKGPQASKD